MFTNRTTKDNKFFRTDPKRSYLPLINGVQIIAPLLCFIIGLFHSAYIFAQNVEFDSSLCGYPVVLFGIPFFDPFLLFKAFFAISSHFFRLEVPIFKGTLILLFWIVGGVFLIYACATLKRKLVKNDRLHGTARLATKKDVEKDGLTKENGVCLGQWFDAVVDYDTSEGGVKLHLVKASWLVQHGGFTSTAVFAASRSGKGVGIIIPTLANYINSMIIFDPKAENWNLTSGWRRLFSHCLRFSPVNKKTTIRFNPLMEISKDFAFRDANTLADVLVTPADGKIDGSQKFWTDSARDALTGFILHVLLSDYPLKSLRGVLDFASSGAGKESDNGEAMLNSMINAYHGENEDCHNVIAGSAMRLLSAPAETRGSIFKTILTALDVFQDPMVAYATNASDFALSDFENTETPISLYLTIPFSDLSRLASLIRIIIVFMLTKFSSGEAQHGKQKLKQPILFLIDEAATIGALKPVETMMGILNGYGIRFMLIFQSFSQVVSLYGENSPLLEHCRVVVTYANSDTKTAKMFSEWAGVKTITYSQQSSSGSVMGSQNSQSIGDQSTQVNLINPDEIQHLPADQALLYVQGSPVARIKKNVWYDDDRFLSKIMKPLPREKWYRKNGKLIKYEERKIYMCRRDMQCEIDALAKLPKDKDADWWKLDDAMIMPTNQNVLRVPTLSDSFKGQ